MKLLVQSAMIFFGTLMAAGVVALGEPGSHVSKVVPSAFARPVTFALNVPRGQQPALVMPSNRAEPSVR